MHRIAVPAIGVDGKHLLQGGIGHHRVLAQIGPHAGQRQLVAPDFPGRIRLAHGVLPPLGLGLAQYRRGGSAGLLCHQVERLGLQQGGQRREIARSDRGVHLQGGIQRCALGQRHQHLGDGVVVPVQALVGHDQMHQLAKAEVAVDADVVVAGIVEVEGDIAHVHRHVLEPGLVGGAAAAGLLLVGVVVGLVVLPAVIAEFVVVPDGNEGKLAVHFLQACIATIGAVQRAVIGQAEGRRGAIGQRHAVGQGDGRMGAFDLAGLEAGTHGFVDVVAHVDGKVQILLGGQQLHGAPVVDTPVLAGEPGKAQAGQLRIGGRSRLADAGGADIAAGLEAVVVARGGLQLADLGTHRVVVARTGIQGLFHQQGGEIFLQRDLQRQGNAVRLCVAAGLHPRPQHHTVSTRIAAGHAQIEAEAAFRWAGFRCRSVVIAATGRQHGAGGNDTEKGCTATQQLPSLHGKLPV